MPPKTHTQHLTITPERNIQYSQILGPDGGTFQGQGGVSVVVPSGATDETVDLGIELVEEDELDKQVPPGCTFAGAAMFDIGDVVLWSLIMSSFVCLIIDPAGETTI